MNKSISKGMVLATVILMDLLAGAELDLFVPSFPELQAHFNLTPFWVEALLSVNFVGYCVSLFFVGGLADRYGRKPIIVLGLLIFTIGSILCFWSGSYPTLLTGRLLQGIGVAAPSILSFLIIADSYPIKKQQYLLAMLNAIMNASIAASPIVGSYVSLYFHWRGNFFALLVLGLITLLMTIFFIPSYKLPEHKDPISIHGYIPIFKSKPLMLLILHIVFMIAPYWIFVGISPLLYMQDLGISLAHFGFYQGALAMVFAIGSILFGLHINRHEQRNLLFFTNVIFIIGVICIAWAVFSDTRNPVFITLSLLPFIVGEIIPSTILYPLSLNYKPKYKARVSAMIQGLRLMVTAIGLQVAGYFYSGTFKNIGLILMFFIIAAIVTLYYILKNREIMNFKQG